MLKPPPQQPQTLITNGGSAQRPTVVDKSINTDTIDWNEVLGVVSSNSGARITISDEGTIELKRVVPAASSGGSTKESVNDQCDEESRYTSNSNVNFEELDLKCMCSEDEEDCGNYTESGCRAGILIKQSSDMHLESRTRINKDSSCSVAGRGGHKKTFESCDNLYSSNSAVSNSSRPKDTKSVGSYQLSFNPYKHTKRVPDKLDSAEITRKLLQVTKADDEPPPVPPRRSNGKPTVPAEAAAAAASGDNSLTTSTAGSDTTGEEAGSSTGSTKQAGKSSKKKSPEKRLVLDLNDKSKYTEEVSV